MVCEEVITQVTLFFKQKVLDTQIQINMDSSGFASFLHVLVMHSLFIYFLQLNLPGKPWQRNKSKKDPQKKTTESGKKEKTKSEKNQK